MNVYVNVLQCDLLDMPSVAQLESDAKYSLLYQLLKILLTQRLDSYLEFQTAKSDLLKSYGNIFVPIILLMLVNILLGDRLYIMNIEPNHIYEMELLQR